MARGPVSRNSEREASTSERSLLDRRDYLRLGATAAALGVTSGTALTGSAAAESRSTPSFNETLNAVDDLGMDPDGNEAIDSALSNAIANDTLVEFPTGEYLLTTEINADNVDNFGIRGTGSNPGDVKFVFPSGNSGASDPSNYVMLYSRGGSGLLLENFEIHQTDDKRTAASLIVYKEDALEIHDVRWTGFNPQASNAKGSCLFPSVTTVDGVGHVSNIEITGGGVVDTYPNRRAGILVQGNHTGELIFDGLDIRETGSSAFRATNGSGVVTLKNSYFENNDNCSFRLGGGDHPSKSTRAVNCTVVADESRLQHLPDGESYENLEGVRIDANGNGWSGATVEQCTFIYRSMQSDWARGVIAAPSFGDHGGFTVRDCTLRVDADNVPPIWAKTPGGDATAPYGITVENVHITGEAKNWGTDGVIAIGSRNGSAVTDCCVDLSDGNAAGVYIENSDNCAVTNSSLNVSGEATAFSNSSVETSGVDTSASCRLPSDDSDDDSESSSGDSASSADSSRSRRSPDTSETTADASTDSETPSDDSGDSTDPDSPTDSGGSGDASGKSSDSSQPRKPSESSETSESSSGSSDNSDLPNTLTIVGRGDPTKYAFSAEELEPKTDSIERWDDVGDTGATGYVTTPENVDTFRFAGPLTRFDFSKGDADVVVNGVNVGAENVAQSITVRAPKEGAVGYRLVVEGIAHARTDASESGESDDAVARRDDGTVVIEDTVRAGHGDAFTFSGRLVHASFDGRPELTLNGNPVDSAAITDESERQTLAIVGAGTPTRYTFSVTGEFTADDDSIERWDDVSDDGAAGWVTSSENRDEFTFTGRVSAFDFEEGAADVYLNGTKVDPSKLGTRKTLTITGSNDAGVTNYSITASDTIASNPDKGTQEGNELPSTSVEDAIGDTTHSYVFSGEITDLRLDGPADLLVDGQAADAASLEPDGLSPLPNVVVFDARNDTEPTGYEMSVSGRLEPASDVGSIESDDAISGSRAVGTVDGDADGLRFDGAIQTLNVDGSARVRFEADEN